MGLIPLPPFPPCEGSFTEFRGTTLTLASLDLSQRER